MFRERENGSSKTGAIGRAIDSLTLINGIGERFKYELKEEKVINFTPLLRRVNNKINPSILSCLYQNQTQLSTMID